MLEALKIYFFQNLVKLSEYQLPTLRYLGSTAAEIAEAKSKGTSWVKPYCHIQERESHLYADQIKSFQEYVNSYPKGSDSHSYNNDKHYEEYIKFIKENATKCNCNCHYKVCPFCSDCGVDHQKDNCSDQKWADVKANHSTWRSYFMDYSDTLNKHEWAIWHSYYDPIGLKLWAKACPCHEVLYDNSRSVADITRFLKHYDSRMLDLNVRLVKQLVT